MINKFKCLILRIWQFIIDALQITWIILMILGLIAGMYLIAKYSDILTFKELLGWFNKN